MYGLADELNRVYNTVTSFLHSLRVYMYVRICVITYAHIYVRIHVSVTITTPHWAAVICSQFSQAFETCVSYWRMQNNCTTSVRLKRFVFSALW